MEAGRFSEACPKLAESQRLDPGGGTILNLAVCYEKDGKLASAWAAYNEALSAAIKDGRKEREQLARERVGALAPKVPRLVVSVPATSEVSGLEVLLDGQPLRRAAWGVDSAVDAGTHRVEARAPGRAGWSAIVAVESSQSVHRIDVPLLEEERAGTILAPVQGGLALAGCPAGYDWNGGMCVPHSTFSVPVGITPTRSNPVYYVTLAATLASFVASGITGYLALQQHGIVKDQCVTERSFCSGTDGINAASNGRNYAWVSTITLGLGIAGTVALFLIPARVATESSRQSATAGGVQ
jgi:hypothetical protein